MTNLELIKKLKDIADNYKTLYVMGCFGAPMNDANKKYYTSNHKYNMKVERQDMINAASDDTFGFDCSCLIKGVLWGFSGDQSDMYGGAVYLSNEVPDIDANHMYQSCYDKSYDFSSIDIGEAVWVSDHIGIYIGDGLVIECSPKWDNKVQYTACNRDIAGYNRRDWAAHGHLPYINYI